MALNIRQFYYRTLSPLTKGFLSIDFARIQRSTTRSLTYSGDPSFRSSYCFRRFAYRSGELGRPDCLIGSR